MKKKKNCFWLRSHPTDPSIELKIHRNDSHLMVPLWCQCNRCGILDRIDHRTASCHRSSLVCIWCKTYTPHIATDIRAPATPSLTTFRCNWDELRNGNDFAIKKWAANGRIKNGSYFSDDTSNTVQIVPVCCFDLNFVDYRTRCTCCCRVWHFHRPMNPMNYQNPVREKRKN